MDVRLLLLILLARVEVDPACRKELDVWVPPIVAIPLSPLWLLEEGIDGILENDPNGVSLNSLVFLRDSGEDDNGVTAPDPEDPEEVLLTVLEWNNSLLFTSFSLVLKRNDDDCNWSGVDLHMDGNNNGTIGGWDGCVVLFVFFGGVSEDDPDNVDTVVDGVGGMMNVHTYLGVRAIASMAAVIFYWWIDLVLLWYELYSMIFFINLKKVRHKPVQGVSMDDGDALSFVHFIHVRQRTYVLSKKSIFLRKVRTKIWNRSQDIQS